MIKLYNIFESLILEGVNAQNVNDAIERKVWVNIDYSGDEHFAAGKRTIEVYSYGLSLGDNPVIGAYQIHGTSTNDSSSSGVPGWKLFRLDRITKWEATKFKFRKPISDRANVPTFNPSGHKKMKTLYNIVKF
jgi:hypothetical protein|tara:strand:+ start:70 stop:468 length:399 start_codon:yes stop_codon:yes gene_type:complete